MLAWLARTRTSLSFASQIPRLILPSIGGGTKRNEMVRAVAVGVGVGEVDGVSIGGGVAEGDGISVGVGVGDSCANATVLKNAIAIRYLNIVPPVQVREKIVARFAIGEEILVYLTGRELVVQFVETAKVIKRAFRRIFARGAGPH